MENDWLFASENAVCGVRTAAVLVKDNKLLVQREKTGEEYALPGGHIKIGETLEAGLVREIAEETGAKIACRRLLWSEESFWTWGGKQAHTISFYFLVELCGPFELPPEGLVPQRDNRNVLIGWMPVDKLETAVIYPEFLKKEVFHLDGPMKHFISGG